MEARSKKSLKGLGIVNFKEEVQHGNLNLISIMCAWATFVLLYNAYYCLNFDWYTHVRFPLGKLRLLKRVERDGNFSSKSGFRFMCMVGRPSRSWQGMKVSQSLLDHSSNLSCISFSEMLCMLYAHTHTTIRYATVLCIQHCCVSAIRCRDKNSTQWPHNDSAYSACKQALRTSLYWSHCVIIFCL